MCSADSEKQCRSVMTRTTPGRSVGMRNVVQNLKKPVIHITNTICSEFMSSEAFYSDLYACIYSKLFGYFFSKSCRSLHIFIENGSEIIAQFYCYGFWRSCCGHG